MKRKDSSRRFFDEPGIASPVGPTPATPVPSQNMLDNSTTDKSFRPSVKQDLTVNVEEANDPQAVRKEVEKISGQEVVKGLAGALEREHSQ